MIKIQNTLILQIVYSSGFDNYENAISCLRDAQKLSYKVMNYTVDMRTVFETNAETNGINERDYVKERYDKSVDGAISHIMGKKNDVNMLISDTRGGAIRIASQLYSKHRKDIQRGFRTRENYTNPQPIIIRKDGLQIYESDGDLYFKYSPYTRDYREAIGLAKLDQIIFRIKSPKNNYGKSKTVDIVRKCLSDDYPDWSFAASKIVRKGSGKKEKWYLHLTYSFPVEPATNKGKLLDKTKYLGVDLGVVNAICASVLDDKEKNALIISGLDYMMHIRKLEKRKSEIQRWVAYCGEGKIGHGTKKRNESVIKLRGKIANYRDSVNRKMARVLIDYAIKNDCGTIQMEDLSGIKGQRSKRNKYLKDWVYYNLQLAIEQAAQKEGIDVIKVDPRYTSQRCSKCGAIHKENRKSQSEFVCEECGFTANADWNASQNLATPYIDKIIRKAMPKKKYKEAV